MALKTKVKQLIRIVEESNIEELEVSSFWGAQKIRVSKQNKSNLQHIVLPPSDNITNQTEVSKSKLDETIPIIEKPEENTISDIESSSKDVIPGPIDPVISSQKSKPINNEGQTSVKAPLVGTFYRSLKPGDPPFISEGDIIEKGQIICIIEAMKIFNEIEAEHSGKIIEILVSDGAPVEYDQPLMIIDPS